MRMLVVVAMLLAFLVLGLSRGAPGEEADLALLTGHWRGELGGTVMEEHWLPPAHGSSTGMLRWFDGDGQIRMLELMTISPEAEGRLIYRMRHFDGEMKPWESEQDGPLTGEVVGHGPERMVIRARERARDLDTITYEAAGEGRLRVTLGFSHLSSRSPIVVEFERVE